MSNTPLAIGLIILGMGIVTYAIRLLPMMLLGRVEGRTLRLLAGTLAAFIAWRTKNALLAIAVGMGALWVLQSVFPH